MSEQDCGLSGEEIERRFDEAEAALIRAFGRQAAKAWPRRVQLEESGLVSRPLLHNDVVITGRLPDGTELEMELTLRASEIFEAISLVCDFQPASSAVRDDIQAARSAFAKAFRDRLQPIVPFPAYLDAAAQAIFSCRYDGRVHRTQKAHFLGPMIFRKNLRNEARRFEQLADWRSDQPELAIDFAGALSATASLIWNVPKGKPPSFDPNDAWIEMGIMCGDERISSAAERHGVKAGWDSRRKPLYQFIRENEEALASQGITLRGVKAAFRCRDARVRRAKKNKSALSCN